VQALLGHHLFLLLEEATEKMIVEVLVELLSCEVSMCST
jgi:hypothetical protein